MDIVFTNLYIETKKAKRNYLCSHKRMKKRYFVIIKRNKKIFNSTTNNTITDLKILLSYLKKHNELKLIYSSYKELLKIILEYKKKFSYLSHISKPFISKKQLINMVKQQNNIMTQVGKLNDYIPNLNNLLK